MLFFHTFQTHTVALGLSRFIGQNRSRFPDLWGFSFRGPRVSELGPAGSLRGSLSQMRFSARGWVSKLGFRGVPRGWRSREGTGRL